MSQQNDTGFLPIVAGAARAIKLRVYNSSGTYTTADATHGCLGVQLQASLAATDGVTIKSVAAAGTLKMVAAGPITAGATVYAAAAGKVDATGTIIEGQALEAATADGDVIEVCPVHNRDVSTATTGTTAATFQVDSDLGKPRAGLKSQTGGTGDYVAYYQAPATLTETRTYTGPADADDTLVGAAATQTLSAKTLASPVITGLTQDSYTATPVAAAGSTVADAGQLPSTAVCHITSDGATKGVKLPAVTVAGIQMWIINNSGTAAELYAESTGTINGGSADASVVIPASKGVWCVSTAAKTWKAFDLAAAASAS